jgi:hypothetical protein
VGCGAGGERRGGWEFICNKTRKVIGVRYDRWLRRKAIEAADRRDTTVLSSGLLFPALIMTSMQLISGLMEEAHAEFAELCSSTNEGTSIESELRTYYGVRRAS